MSAYYDPEILQQYADALYSRAMFVQIAVTCLGLIFGGVLGAALPVTTRKPDSSITLLFAAVCGAVGFAIGRAMAFKYKLEAQQALCQLQIEINTRPETAAKYRAATAGN
jgi:hypothetical protein